MRGSRQKLFGAMAMAVLMAGCATVTLTQQGKRKLSSHPNYQKQQTFFLWGLVGEQYIDVRNVCGAAGVTQLQTQNTFVDGVLQFLTLGIYAPRTAKIWCNRGA